MWSKLREMDRHFNLDRYPRLFFPESYVLEGGYNKFHKEHPLLCDGGYLPADAREDTFLDLYATCKKNHKKYEPRQRSGLLLLQQARQ